MDLSIQEQVILSNFVSNVSGNVYTIYNLPEEVIAVIFAYVSRSSKSFRENLLSLIQDGTVNQQLITQSIGSAQDKASKFHEKWVVGYGHSSVAEHAIAHIGVEKISRLASAELELSNDFSSFTEYSQRYQGPKQGDFYIPSGFSDEDKERYIAANNRFYEAYTLIHSGLVCHLAMNVGIKEGESDRQFDSRIEKMAFEDARYILPLSTLASLGMTSNGRALRDGVVNLLTSRYEESVQLGESLRNELQSVMPTLLRHVQKDEAKATAIANAEQLCEKIISTSGYDGSSMSDMPDVTLFPTVNESAILTLITHSLLVSEMNMPPYSAYKVLEMASEQEKIELFESIVKDLKPHSNPLDHLKQINYRVYFCLSEACWHQLLRHNRGADFVFQRPTTQNGYVTPQNIYDAGMTELFDSTIKFAEDEFAYFYEKYGDKADYLVTNAHKRGVLMSASAWELYHLLNLRTSPMAQEEIRKAFNNLYGFLNEVHPIIFKYARRRLELEE